MHIANETRKYDTLFKQHIERGKRIIALEVAKDNAEKESRDLQKQLDHAEADRIELRAERATLENKLTDALAKVRKRDKDGKFLPSGNARPKRVKKVKAASDAEHAFDEMMGNPIEQLQEAFSQIKAESPKLVHGLTVKNPTEDEARMIFDEARRLGLPTDNTVKHELHSVIWYGKRRGISWGSDLHVYGEEFVTAKEFVQRMQNGRG